MNPIDEAAIAARLDKLLADFGHEYEWPYRFMSNTKPPADQQLEAQKQLRAEAAAVLSALIREVAESIIPTFSDMDVAGADRMEGYRACALGSKRRLDELVPKRPGL